MKKEQLMGELCPGGCCGYRYSFQSTPQIGGPHSFKLKKLRLSNLAKPLTSASFHAMETDKNLKAMEI